MGKIRDNIQAMIVAAGPDKVTLPVTAKGVTNDYTFRVLTVNELDKLGIYAFGDNGRIDRDRMVGNNARWVAATLVDDDGSLFDVNDVETWPAAFVTALAEAARKANAQNVTVEDAAKNSGATAGGGT